MGGSFGLQAGAQSTDLVLVFQTQRGLDRFIKGKGKLTLGVDASAAAGPVGKRFEAGTDAALKSEILSYSNSQGDLRRACPPRVGRSRSTGRRTCGTTAAPSPPVRSWRSTARCPCPSR